MHISNGHSVQQQQTERVGGPPPSVSADRQMPAGKGGGFAINDVVDLSTKAKSFMATAGQTTGPGNSMNSTAHQARALIAEHETLAGKSFGQVVSNLNHGTLNLTSPVTDGEETGDPAAADTTESTTVADVEDGAADTTSDPVVADDTTPDPVVADDTTSDPVVADDTTSDPVVVADTTSDPVVVADTTFEPLVVADTTSTLLDILESNEDQAESDPVV